MTEARAASRIGVRLALFADLRRLLPAGHDGPLTFSLERGATVADLLAAAGVPEGGDITIGRNGEQVDRDALLADGDEVVLFSPMEGG
jgi:molybdopterin converting factor small subunit